MTLTPSITYGRKPMKTFLPFAAMIMILMLTGVSEGQTPEAIKLPAPSLERSAPLMKVLQERKSERAFADRQLSLQDLANVLWCANGINRPQNGNRTSPSARNAQDIGLYVVLKDGAYFYDPKQNQLVLVAAGDYRMNTGMQPYVATAPVNIIYVSDTDKLGFVKEREEMVMTAGIDAGHCSQNVYLYSASAGLSTVVRTSVDRKKMTEILKLGPHHLVIMGQTVGYPK
jgi:SagB-type dehydrogenase family enzyme